MHICGYGNMYIFNVFLCMSLIKLMALMKIDLMVSVLPSYPKRKTFIDYHNAAIPTHFMWNTLTGRLNHFALAHESSRDYIFVEPKR